MCTERWRSEVVFEFALEILTDRPGYLAFRVTGKDAERVFQHEKGGHRWQRVPPNEKRGRVHTSTVTVAILAEPTSAEVRLEARDLVIRNTKSGGPGGQHANKTNSAVVVTHVPSGITVRMETKSQYRNRELALAVLRARLHARQSSQQHGDRNARRKSQVGSGMRGDKRRTIAVQRGSVTDHQTGKRTTAKRYLRGHIDDLWP